MERRRIGAEVMVRAIWGPAGGFFPLQTSFLFFEPPREANFENLLLDFEIFSCFCEGGFGFEKFFTEMLEFGGARGELMV